MSTLALEANIENKMLGLKKMGEQTPAPVATLQRLQVAMRVRPMLAKDIGRQTCVSVGQDGEVPNIVQLTDLTHHIAS
jgi:hypothetical protein